MINVAGKISETLDRSSLEMIFTQESRSILPKFDNF